MAKTAQPRSVLLIITILALAPLSLAAAGGDLKAWTETIHGVMGTTTELTAVTEANSEAAARAAIAKARGELERVEGLMSYFKTDSELSRLNASPVGQEVDLSPATMEVLRAAAADANATSGAFDVTCGPLMQLWVKAAARNEPPSGGEVDEALRKTGWRNFRLLEHGAMRLTDGACIDLGGIAKKYGIDQAVKAMKAAGVAGGLVNVGGDIGCFGASASGGPWTITVRDAFSKDRPPLATVRLSEGTICTSGNYERFDQIDGRRYSHIKDPRTGIPVDAYPSVTVIGRDALSSGIWATALSVLGPQGFSLIPKDSGIEAMVVVGAAEDPELHMTPGFAKYMAEGSRASTMPANQAPTQPAHYSHATPKADANDAGADASSSATPKDPKKK